MIAHQDDTDLFPAFAKAEGEEGQRRRAAASERHLNEHREHLAICWPEWRGPAANGPGTSGFCEVNTLDAFSLTHGERRDHYMAPCRIESVSSDGLTILAVVEYQSSCPCADLYNGERLRLDLSEVWPPGLVIERATARTARRSGHRRTSSGGKVPAGYLISKT